MESSGVIRRFDELGRIVIPKAYCKAVGLDIYEGVPMEISVNEEHEIVLRPYGINEAREHGTEFLNVLTELPSMVSQEELDVIRGILSRFTPSCQDN